MKKHHWKRASFVVVRGLLLVFIAAILQWAGDFDRFEGNLYDYRVRYCQQFRPAPTPTLVQMDIDESSISYIGRWPWDRTKLARIIDEIALAKPKIVALDIIFGEPTDIVYGPNDPKGVDADATLAAAFSRLGCAVVPVSMKVNDFTPVSQLQKHMLPLLVENPEATEKEVDAELESKGFSSKPDQGSDDSYLQIREQAFYERIWREAPADKTPVPEKEVIKRLMLPHEDPQSTGSVLDHLFDEQYRRVTTERAIAPFTLLDTDTQRPLFAPKSGIAPILPLAKAAAYSGFVDFVPEGLEGTVRRIPLLVRYRDRLVPQMDLVTACAVLGADIKKLKLTDDTLSVPVPGNADLKIPVSVEDIPNLGPAGAFMEIPLFGRRNDWLTMNDPPLYQKQAQHVNVYEVWQICETLDKLKRNEEHELPYLLDASAIMFQPTPYKDSPPTGQAMDALVQDTLTKLQDFLNSQAADPDAKTDPDIKATIARGARTQSILKQFAGQTGKLNLQLNSFRNGLAAKLSGKTIFFGGTATGLLDLQPTSLFQQCPGVVIHGSIYNAILTGKMWRVTQPWLGTVLTVVFGLLTMLIVVSFSPAAGFASSLLLAGGYLFFNGIFLFAHDNLIVNAAGPLWAVGLVWPGMTLTSYLTERAERSRIIKRFQGYVDPRLVDIMVDDPNHAGFDGETREVTCCFSDLAGFTTLTDQMGAKIVPLLSAYMSAMIPVIRQHEGYVSQMAGDGIYFFFGAPAGFADHAGFAMTTSFGMYKALDAFNLILKDRGLPQLGMRIGIATGDVIVGDTGSKDSHAYTAMGATVNLASRLEGANKVFGSRMLMTQRTLDLLHGKYLVRPLANLRVKGKLNCDRMYEPVCLLAEATEADHLLVAHTTKVFEAYRVGNFDACLTAAAEMDQVYGPSEFTELYTSRAKKHLADCITLVEWEGEIVLTEK